MLKARECTAFSASSTKQEINKTKLIYSLGNLERDIRNLHYNHMLTLIVTRQPLKQSYCRKILSLLKDWQIKLLRETGLCSLLLCQHISWQNMEVANSKLLSLLKHLDTSGVKHFKIFFIQRRGNTS